MSSSARIGGLRALFRLIGAPPPPSPSPPSPPPAPATFDDTTMTTTSTGTARNGPGIYHGFTATTGSGTVSVYNGLDATGTLIHQVTNPTLGVFQAAPGAPIACDNIWAVQGSRTIAYRID